MPHFKVRKGPSFCLHAEEEESSSGGRMWIGERSLFLVGIQNELEPTDVILSSSHAKKLTLFVPEFYFWTE